VELLLDVTLDTERLYLLDVPGPRPEPDPVQDVDDRVPFWHRPGGRHRGRSSDQAQSNKAEDCLCHNFL